MSAVPSGWTSETAVAGRFTRTRSRSVQLLAAAPALPVTDVVALIEADDDFAAAIPPEDRALAASALRLPCLTLQTGPWRCPPGTGPAPSSFVVLGGLMSRSMTRYGRASIELFGPGDMINCDEPAEGAVQWAVHQPSSLIYLNERFAMAGRRWPALWHVLLNRTAQRAERLAAHLAALQLSRVEDRIEAVLWQLADRWGRVTPEGVVVPISLTHELLGRLTAAKRPTVSVALAALADTGKVDRRPDGSWLIAR